jgi:hypothetical protein
MIPQSGQSYNGWKNGRQAFRAVQHAVPLRTMIATIGAAPPSYDQTLQRGRRVLPGNAKEQVNE